MIWIGISLATSLLLSFLLPFPISLLAIIAVFLAMNYFMRRQQMRRTGMMGGIGHSLLGGETGSSKVTYSCITCGHRHAESRCPSCGSNMKKAEF